MDSKSKKEEKEIIKSLKRSDKNALTQIYNDYWKQLFISAYNLLKDRELSEEIVQDVFINLWNYREKIDIKISLKAYLYACVRYKVFSQFKKNKIKHTEVFDDLKQKFQYSTPETKMMHQELVMQIEAIVRTLPPKCQEVYLLSRNEQLSHKEISEKLNISTKTVENHITYALKVLRGGLGHMLTIELLYLIYL